jgi:tetratricopeptide (TPR) repeat protein
MVDVSFSELRALYDKGYFEEYLKRFDELQATDRLALFPAEEQFVLMLWEINILEFYFRSEEVNDILQEAKLQPAFQNLPLNKLGFILLQVQHCDWTQQFEKVSHLLEQGEELLASLPSSDQTNLDMRIAFFNRGKAVNSARCNDPKKVLEYANNAKDMFHKLDDSFSEIFLLGPIAYAQDIDGNLDISIDLNKQRLYLAESHDYPLLSHHSLVNLCYSYLIRGDLTKALEAGHKGLAIWQSLQQRNPALPDDSYILHNLGEVYRVKGDFDNALLYLKQSLAISEARGDAYTAERLTEIGKVYYQQGDVVRAKDFLQRGFALYQTGDFILQSEYLILHSVFGLIRIAFEEDDLEQVQRYRREMESLKTKAKSKVAQQLSDEYLQLIDALILKHSSRALQKVNAQQQLTEFVQKEIVHHEIKALAMVHLCELLLDELRLYGDAAVFQETQNVINELYSLGKTHQTYPLIIQALMLKTQFAVWQGQLDIATKYATQAELLAEEKGLSLLGTQVKQIQQQLESEFMKAQELIQHNEPLQKRIEQSKLDAYLKEIQKTIKF